MPSDVVTYVLALTIGLLVTYCGRRYRLRHSVFPPGPPRKPIIGNLEDIRYKGVSEWKIYTKWKEIYGDLVGLKVFGTNIVILNSEKAMRDLLETRGAIYSDRPKFTVLGELMGLNRSMGLQPYDAEWRACRRLVNVGFGPAAVKQYRPVQEKFAAMLASEILENPANFYNLVRTSGTRIVLAITYGLSERVIDEEYVVQAEATLKLVSQSMVPGTFFCDFLPIMKYLPRWFSFQRKARVGRKMIETIVVTPFERVKHEMLHGRAGPSLTRELLSNAKDGVLTEETEERIKWTTGSMYGAGSDTTGGTMIVFFAAMTLYPEVQKKAQQEIDLTIGTDRLPDIRDRAHLPYVDALVKEVMRWHPMLPLSIYRCATADDVYEGYFIPKGTIIIPNIWQIAFQPDEQYPPEEFIPERFLDPEHQTLNPNTWAFGFGRRDCPGKLLGETSVFIMISTLLSVLSISSDPEEPIKTHTSYGGIPKRFRCRITPRCAEREELIRLALQ